MSKSINPLGLLATDPVQLSIFSVKSKLMMIITSLIKQDGMTQVEAAKKIGVSQPRISSLMNGEVSKFSIETLLEMIGRLGFLMDIKFDPSNESEPMRIDIKNRGL